MSWQNLSPMVTTFDDSQFFFIKKCKNLVNQPHHILATLITVIRLCHNLCHLAAGGGRTIFSLGKIPFEWAPFKMSAIITLH